MSEKLPPSNMPEDRRQTAEDQIKEKQKAADFDIREYPIEVIVSKFTSRLESDKAELFIPDYQREMVWKSEQQARFIESILLDLPIPYLYVADVTSGEDEGRIEVVDGSQRIRTLVRFLACELQLENLEVLTHLNGFCFMDLTGPRQLRFKRKTLRMIELIEVDEEARRQLFDRLNSGGTHLNDMEKRFGSRDGEFIAFVRQLALDPLLQELCPISEVRKNHREYEEMILRFFAYRERYHTFSKSVFKFLNEFVDEKNVDVDRDAYQQYFTQMLKFVSTYFPFGFKKGATNQSVPRIRFEAISVGVSLAIEAGCNEPADLDWLDSEEFRVLTRSDASNSRPKVIARIDFVKNKLLGLQVNAVADEAGADDVDD